MKQLVLTVCVAAVLAGCSSTEIVKSWQEPGATIQKTDLMNKVLVLAMVKDETSRRVIEDEMVKRIGAKAVASYTVLSSDDMKSAAGNTLDVKINAGKFTHLLIMRLADVEKDTYYVQGSTAGYYGGYGRYYGYGVGYYNNPGYYTTDKNYFVETAIYSVQPDKLLWTGTTKTVNPSKIEKTVNEIADVVYEKMVADGFLK